MATFDDVRRIAATLPLTASDESSVSVADKGIVWTWKERVEPKKARVERRDVAAFWVRDLDVKEALLADDPQVFFTEPHYDGYRAVLVRLPEIALDELAALLLDGWRARAPKRAVTAYDATR